MAALHPTHRHNKASKLVVELLLKQGAVGDNSTRQYAGEPYVGVFHDDIFVDTLVHKPFKALDREEGE
jgi:hypothetical protein